MGVGDRFQSGKLFLACGCFRRKMFQFWKHVVMLNVSFCMEIGEMVSKIKTTYCKYKVNEFDNQKFRKWFCLMDPLFIEQEVLSWLKWLVVGKPIALEVE